MKSAWRFAVFFLLAGFLTAASGLWMTRNATRQLQLPRGLESAHRALDEVGGQEGLDRRSRALEGLRSRLTIAQQAASSDTGALGRRVDEVFDQAGVSVVATSGWQPLADVELQGGVAFECTFRGTGTFAAVLRTIASLESWPDGLAVRALNLEPAAAGAMGSIDFELQLVVVRVPRPDSTAGVAS